MTSDPKDDFARHFADALRIITGGAIAAMFFQFYNILSRETNNVVLLIVGSSLFALFLAIGLAFVFTIIERRVAPDVREIT
jgi:hypothetical protein